MRGTRLLVLGVLLAGCGGTRTAWMPLNDPPRPMAPRPPSEVKMFTSGVPKEEYVEIGLISTGINSTWSTEGAFDLIRLLRDEGAKHGCDAVVVTDENKVSEGTAYHGTYSSSATSFSRTSNFRAACIQFKAPPSP